MEIGIIGLPKGGKTTVFNALTRGRAQVSDYSVADRPNLGVAKMPDQRLDGLTRLFNPKKTVPAEVIYVDVPGAPEALGKGQSVGGEFLNRLQKVDAILHVVRSFDDPSLPHIEGSVNPYRDIATMDLELAFSDLAIVERRLQKLQDELKGAKAQEREVKHKEMAILERIKAELEKGMPIRAQSLSSEEARLLQNYQFLTAKPLLIVLNIDEGQLGQACHAEKELASKILGPAIRSLVICGKLERDLSQMEAQEENEFRESLGAGESALERMIKASYDLLGLISFFTVGADEVRAWTITQGTVAQKAAGKVHSDMERGFIRAEVIAYEDLIGCGSIAEGRRKGLLRLEGKTYVVRDGDVITFLFNI